MPSPIAHSAVGYAFYRLYRRRFPGLASNRSGPVPWLLAIAVGFSLLPDIDSLAGLLAGDFGRYHNNLTHSMIVAAGVALLAGVAGAFMGLGRFLDWFSLAFLCYGAHVLMDAATIGKGVMAFWPLTDERFLSPLPLFFGFHWSDGWLNRRHWWTAATELAFAGLVFLLLRRRTSQSEGWR
jgi:membrane-bound metal-dependent hydrolase YbcI (DUF457 family)